MSSTARAVGGIVHVDTPCTLGTGIYPKSVGKFIVYTDNAGFHVAGKSIPARGFIDFRPTNDMIHCDTTCRDPHCADAGDDLWSRLPDNRYRLGFAIFADTLQVVHNLSRMQGFLRRIGTHDSIPHSGQVLGGGSFFRSDGLVFLNDRSGAFGPAPYAPLIAAFLNAGLHLAIGRDICRCKKYLQLPFGIDFDCDDDRRCTAHG